MDPDQLLERYRELQSYVGWTDDDAERITAAAPLLETCLESLVDDFYAEIERHPDARKVITGGQAQIERLKGTLVQWIRELLAGTYDADYVAPPLASRLAARRDRPGSGLYQRRAVPAAHRAGRVASTRRWQGDDLRTRGRRSARSTSCSISTWRSSRTPTRASTCRGCSEPSDWRPSARSPAGVAHELRNPLNVVKTSVYYLLNARNPTPEKKAEHLQRIERNVELADNVITSLSNFARMPVPNLRPIAVEPLVREALRSTRPARGSRSRSTVPPELPHALGDGDQLRIALGQPDPQCQRRDAAGGPAGDHGARSRRVRRAVGCPIPASGSSRKTWPGSWSRSTRPRPAGWAWGLRSRDRSWKRTRVASG